MTVDFVFCFYLCIDYYVDDNFSGGGTDKDDCQCDDDQYCIGNNNFIEKIMLWIML